MEKEKPIRTLEEVTEALWNGEEVSDAEFDAHRDEMKKISDNSKYKPTGQRSFSSEKELKKYFDNRWAKDRTPEDIETVREDLGIRPGKVLRLKYKDTDGDISERDIEVLKVIEKSGDLYITAFCHFSLKKKTFRKSRILSLTCEGQPINDVREYIS